MQSNEVITQEYLTRIEVRLDQMDQQLEKRDKRLEERLERRLEEAIRQIPCFDWKWFISVFLPIIAPILAAAIIGYFSLNAQLKLEHHGVSL